MFKKSPIKISWKTEWFSWLLLIVAAAASFYFYAHFPDRVATHWNFRGEADGFSPRSFAAFFFPGLLAFMYALLLVMPCFDPKRERYADFAGIYNIFRNLMLAVLFVVYIAASGYNLGWPINVGIVTAATIGILMIVLGNYMGKIKNNWFMGIRTPWTMSSENVWNQTHRVGGRLFMAWGVLLIIAPFLPELLGLAILLGGALVLVGGTFGYSYWLYRKEQK